MDTIEPTGKHISALPISDQACILTQRVHFNLLETYAAESWIGLSWYYPDYFSAGTIKPTENPNKCPGIYCGAEMKDFSKLQNQASALALFMNKVNALVEKGHVGFLCKASEVRNGIEFKTNFSLDSYNTLYKKRA